MSAYAICVLLLLLNSCLAFDLQEKNSDVQSHRGIGLEEIALFLVGLGIASALALSIVIGPLFAIFYSTIQGLPYGGINGGNSNTISTVAGGSRGSIIQKQMGKILTDKLHEGVKLLEEAVKKYDKTR